jgi:hypothetical protein
MNQDDYFLAIYESFLTVFEIGIIFKAGAVVSLKPKLP